MSNSTHIDATFPLRGKAIPMDHGYALFSALSRHLPAIRQRAHWAIHPVLGQNRGGGVLALFARSRLRIRLPTDQVGDIMSLAESTLDIAGHKCTVGFPRLYPLRSTPHLQSRLVIIKIGPNAPDSSPDDPVATFETALRRQIARLPDLRQDPERIEVQVGPRRILRIKGVTIAGHAVALTGLGAHASISVQTHGLGGRRHMGAGVFIPPRRSA